MALQGCFSIIGMWSVGVSGECFHQDIGFPVGMSANSFKKVVLQVWIRHLISPYLEGVAGYHYLETMGKTFSHLYSLLFTWYIIHLLSMASLEEDVKICSTEKIHVSD